MITMHNAYLLCMNWAVTVRIPFCTCNVASGVRVSTNAVCHLFIKFPALYWSKGPLVQTLWYQEICYTFISLSLLRARLWCGWCHCGRGWWRVGEGSGWRFWACKEPFKSHLARILRSSHTAGYLHDLFVLSLCKVSTSQRQLWSRSVHVFLYHIPSLPHVGLTLLPVQFSLRFIAIHHANCMYQQLS